MCEFNAIAVQLVSVTLNPGRPSRLCLTGIELIFMQTEKLHILNVLIMYHVLKL